MEVAQLDIVIRQEQAVSANREVQQELAKTGDAAERTSKQAGSAFDRLKNSVFSLKGALAGLGAIGIGRYMLDTIKDFEQGMSNVKAVTNATTKDMALLSAEARKLGATTTYSAGEAAQGMAELAQAGFNTTQILDSTGSALKLAQGAMIPLKDAAEIAANVINGFQISTSNATAAMDVMAKTANISNADIRSLGESMKYVGPIAKQMGLSLEQTSAAIGVLSNNGLAGSMAGTGLRQTLLSLVNPTSQAAKAIQELGINIKDVNPSTNSFVDILKRFKAANLDSAAASTIFGDRAATAMLVLSENIGTLEAYTKANENANGALDQMAKDMTDNLGGAIKNLQSALDEMILQTGDAGLAGALKGAINFLTNLINAMNGMLPVTDATSLGFNILAKALMVVMGALAGFAVGKAVSFMVSLAAEAVTLTKALYAAAAGQTALNAAMNLNPIVLIITLLGAAAVAVGLLGDAFSGLTDSGVSVTDAISKADAALAKYAETANRAAGESQKAIDAMKSQSIEQMNVALVEVNKALDDMADKASDAKDEIADLRLDATGLNFSAINAYAQSLGLFGEEAKKAGEQSLKMRDDIDKAFSEFMRGTGSVENLVSKLQALQNSGLSGADSAGKLAQEILKVGQDAGITGNSVEDLRKRKELLTQAINGTLSPLEAARLGMNNVANQAVASADSVAVFGQAMVNMARDSMQAINALNGAASAITGFERQAKLSGMSVADQARQRIRDQASDLRAQVAAAQAVLSNGGKLTPAQQRLLTGGVDAATQRINTAESQLISNVKDPAAAASSRRTASAARAAAATTRRTENDYQRILDEVDPVSAAYRKIEKDIQAVQKAEAAGLITHDESAKAIALLRTRLEEQGDPYKKLLTDMTNENALMNESKRDREIDIELKQRVNDLRDKGRILTEDETKALREQIKTNQLMAQKDSLADWYKGVQDSLDPLGQAQREYQKQLEQLELFMEAFPDKADEASAALERWKKINVDKDYRATVDMGIDRLKADNADTGGRVASALPQVYSDAVGPMDEILTKQKALNELFSAGMVGIQDYTKAMEGLNLEMENAKAARGELSDWEGFQVGIDNFISSFKASAEQFSEMSNQMLSTFTDGVSKAFGDAIVYGKDLGDALRSVAQTILSDLIGALIKMGIQWVIQKTLKRSLDTAELAAGTAMMGTAAATSAAMGATVAAAWAPAAAAVSLASFGANSGPAMAGIGATYGMTSAMSVLGLKDGGWVSGPGGPKEDKVPAMLSDGEFVVNAAAAKQNAGMLEAMNRGLPLAEQLVAANDNAMIARPSQNAVTRRANGGWVGDQPNTRKAESYSMDADRLNVVSRDTATTAAAANVTNKVDVAAAVPDVKVPVKVVNVTNPNDVLDAMDTEAGGQIIFNYIERNPDKVKRAIER